MTNVFRSAKSRHNTKIDFNFRNSSKNWSEEWKQSRFFVKTIKNFCNVIKSYRDIDYFRFFNIIWMQKSLSNNDNSSFTSETSSKSESNFSIKVSQRQRFFAHDLNDSSISFDQRQTFFSKNRRQNSFSVSSFSSLSKANNLTFFKRQIIESNFTSRSSTNFRRQINDVISTEKALYHHLINLSSSSSNNDDMIISSNQLQRMINAVIDNYIQRHSSISKSFEFVEFSKSRNVNDFDDTNADDNVNVSWIIDEFDFFSFSIRWQNRAEKWFHNSSKQKHLL